MTDNKACALFEASPFTFSLMWADKKWIQSWCSLLRIRQHTFEVHFQVGPIRLQPTAPSPLVTAQLSKQMG